MSVTRSPEPARGYIFDEYIIDWNAERESMGVRSPLS